MGAVSNRCLSCGTEGLELHRNGPSPWLLPAWVRPRPAVPLLRKHAGFSCLTGDAPEQPKFDRRLPYGERVPTEDDRFLRGQGTYVADLRIPGTLEAALLRSPQAHAAVRRIDVSAARLSPGVVAVFTAADLAGRTEPLCVSGEVHTPERLMQELKPMDRPHPIPLLPASRVSHAGQPVAMVVAESRYAAMDAAELIDVEYEPLPIVTDPVRALAPGAPLVEPRW